MVYKHKKQSAPPFNGGELNPLDPSFGWSSGIPSRLGPQDHVWRGEYMWGDQVEWLKYIYLNKMIFF